MPGNRKNIIVVDDDEGMNQAIERLLHAAGFEVVTFDSAEAVLEAGAANDAACMVLDVHLPGLSGFELRQRLAASGATPPTIFITAYDEPEAREEAEKNGAVAFLSKPFSGRLLTRAVHQALDTQWT